MSISRCQREISSPEFAEWIAFDRLDPIGREREDRNAGLVAMMIANANRDPKAHPEAFGIDECTIHYDRAAIRQESPGVMAAKIKAFLGAVKNSLSKKKG